MKNKINFSQIIKLATKENFEIKEGQNYVSIVARKIVLPIRYFCALGYSNPEICNDIYGFNAAHKPFYDSWRHVFVDRSTMQLEKEKMIEALSKNSNYLYEIAEKCEKDAELLMSYTQNLKTINTSPLSDIEIKKYIQTSFEKMMRISGYLLFPLSIQGWLEENVKTKLKERITDEEQFESYYTILSTPSRQNTGYYEQLNITELALLYGKGGAVTSDMNKEIDDYLLKYNSQGVKYGYGNLWTKEDIKERLKLLCTENNLELKLKRLKSLPKEHDENVVSLLKNIHADEDFKNKVGWSRLYMYVRTLRTDVLSASFTNMIPLFQEVAKRCNLNLEEVMECSPDELVAMKFPSKDKIKNRALNNIARAIDGVIYYKNGNEAEKISKNLVKKPQQATEGAEQNIREIKGNIANKGKINGVVKVIFDNSELDKISRGDILVTAMTTPDFVPAMEKAAAFVTDEGGLLCHAAIISREMNKPCIIGTKNATQILKDGDVVEVDANVGVVKILK